MKKFTFFLIALCGIQIFPQLTVIKDNTFGNNGLFTVSFNSNSDFISSNILLLPNDEILYIIHNADKNSMLKVKSDGTLDANFADHGRLEFSENNFINAVLQGDKIIVYLGPKPQDYSNYVDSKILRFNKNGSLDTTFGSNGVLNEVTESTNPQSLSVLVLADQSLVVSNSNSTYPKKFTADGQLDSGFGNNGEIIYDYHFPIGQSSTGKIATCDINSLSSSVYSFYNLNSLTTNKVLNLNSTTAHQYNGFALQNKTNSSTRMSDKGTVYSVFEYQNYPLPTFSRLVVINNEKLDTNFNGKGFLTSENDEQFLDVGLEKDVFFILNQKVNKKSLRAYSAAGNSLTINNNSELNLISGQEIEMKDNYILVNSVIPGNGQNIFQVKVEKFLITNESLGTLSDKVENIEIENPVNDFLNIKNAENAESLEVYSIDGKKVLSSKTFKNLNLSNLTKGNYILKISMKNGRLFSKKLIKN